MPGRGGTARPCWVRLARPEGVRIGIRVKGARSVAPVAVQALHFGMSMILRVSGWLPGHRPVGLAG